MNHFIYEPDKNQRSQEQANTPQHPTVTPGGNWQYTRERKRSTWKSYFAALMSGAMLMGGLMFASDHYNWFGKVDSVVQSTIEDVSLKNFNSGNRTVSGSVESTGSTTSSPRTAALSSAGDVVRPNQIADIVQISSPAVVKIQTTVPAKVNNNSFLNDQFFQYFFGDQGSSQDQQQQQQEQPGGMGTGFFFEKSGYILTNEHVIDGASGITVIVEGYDKPFVAKLLGSDKDLDLAVLKIENSKEFPVLPLGSSDDIRVGDWVIAIGNPYDFEHTVTVGVLSAKERPIDIPEQSSTRHYKHLLQTDASINPGNSGGPLLNLNGEVIGINTAVSAEAQGIGFAIPTSTISSVLDNLKNNVTVAKPYIGIYMRSIDKTWLKELGLSNTNGAFVTSVVTNGPADRAGIQPYDVITAVNGKSVKTPDELTSTVKTLKVGTKAVLTVIRDGQSLTTAVIVDDRNKTK